MKRLAGLAGVCVALAAAPAAAAPGPDILYAPPASAPQLENAGVWRAPPILVSGATAYRDGEFLYQDYLYDDHGAAGAPDAAFLASHLFSPAEGSFSYPDETSDAGNAADLVELRVKPLADATRFRVTLNTIVDPDRVAFTIALGSSPVPVAWPHGAGVSSPAQRFLTVHGRTADLAGVSVSVDLSRRQYDVTVPHAAWDPGRQTVRMAAGVGLWDTAAGRYQALVNLAFRTGEPKPDPEVVNAAWTLGDAAATVKADGTWWRERAQADALRIGDISPFHADVSFAKLAAGTRDDSGVPRAGWLDRIFASRFSFGQGVDLSKACPRFPASCEGMLRGQLQTYALYVPDRTPPRSGWGLTLLLHALSANHNLYSGSRFGSQLGERGPGSLVLTPGSRGPDGDYTEFTEADVFEAWADVARAYRLDPGWVAIAGFSMGGGGTYKLIERWPDLFARGMGLGAAPKTEGDQGQWLPALRNVPIMTWAGALDEGTDATVSEQSISALGAAGVRFVYDVFAGADHVTNFTNDEFAPVAEFLGEHRIELDPPHVSYVVDSRANFPAAGVVADHAYWLSDLRIRDASASPTATVDARSEGFGAGDATPLGTKTSTGTLEGGRHGPMAYRRSRQDWSAAPPAPKADVLVLDATNLASATIDMRRARLSCDARLDVKTDGPLALRLGGCGVTRSYRPR